MEWVGTVLPRRATGRMAVRAYADARGAAAVPPVGIDVRRWAWLGILPRDVVAGGADP